MGGSICFLSGAGTAHWDALEEFIESKGYRRRPNARFKPRIGQAEAQITIVRQDYANHFRVRIRLQ